MQRGRKACVKSSPILRIHTAGGTAMHANAKCVKLNRKKVKLSKGKTYKLKVKVRKSDKSKRLMPKSRASGLRYLSSDDSNANASIKGKRMYHVFGAREGACLSKKMAFRGSV